MIRLGIMALARTLKFIESLLRPARSTRVQVLSARRSWVEIQNPRSTRVRVVGVLGGVSG